MSKQCTENNFLRDVASHKMEILKDDRLYRHLRFSRPKSNAYWFDILTWPGELCITGDMGTHVFRRTKDMFNFFRMDEHDFNYSRNGTLSINPGYWQEKLVSERDESAKEYDSDTFIENIKDWHSSYYSDEPESEQAKEVWRDIEEDILCLADDEQDAYRAALNFESDSDPDFNFTDFFEVSSRVYRSHFLWCLYAIVWGIQQYDAHKKAFNPEKVYGYRRTLAKRIKR